MNKESIFDDISIMGRVAYIIFSIETYLYIKQLLGEKTPSAEPFRIYSIYERTCWGDYTSGKDVLLKQMNKQI